MTVSTPAEAADPTEHRLALRHTYGSSTSCTCLEAGRCHGHQRPQSYAPWRVIASRYVYLEKVNRRGASSGRTMLSPEEILRWQLAWHALQGWKTQGRLTAGAWNERTAPWELTELEANGKAIRPASVRPPPPCAVHLERSSRSARDWKRDPAAHSIYDAGPYTHLTLLLLGPTSLSVTWFLAWAISEPRHGRASDRQRRLARIYRRVCVILAVLTLIGVGIVVLLLVHWPVSRVGVRGPDPAPKIAPTPSIEAPLEVVDGE